MKRSGLVKVILFAAAAAALFLAVRYTPLGRILDPASLAARRNELLDFVRTNLALAALVYMGAYFAAVALSIPGATVLTLLGGFLFGPVPAALLVNLGATTGAFVIFFAARKLLGSSLREKYGAQLERFDREMGDNGASYLLFVRLVPVFPFFLVNLLSGLTSVKPRTFLWTTAAGILPGSLAYAYLGSLGSVTEGAALPGRVLVAFGLLGAVSLIPVMLRKRRARRAAGKDPA